MDITRGPKIMSWKINLILILLQLKPGTHYDPQQNKLVTVEQHEEDTPADYQTFRVLKQVADSINSNIIMEIDVPSSHEDGRLPVLNLGMWVNNNNKVSIRLDKMLLYTTNNMIFNLHYSSTLVTEYARPYSLTQSELRFSEGTHIRQSYGSESA